MYIYARDQKKTQFSSAPTILNGTKISLRRLERSDFKSLSTILSKPEVADPFFLNGEGMVPEIPPWFFLCDALIGQFFEQRLAYSVLNNRTGSIDGFIEIRKEPSTQTYQVAGFATPSQWGGRASQETIILIMKVFFDVLRLTKLHSFVAPKNVRAQKYNEKSGFVFSHISQEELTEGCLVYTLDREHYTGLVQQQPQLLHIKERPF